MLNNLEEIVCGRVCDDIFKSETVRPDAWECVKHLVNSILVILFHTKGNQLIKVGMWNRPSKLAKLLQIVCFCSVHGSMAEGPDN